MEIALGAKDLIFAFFAALCVAALFIGWVALLHFPWVDAVQTVLICEAIAIVLLLLAESSAGSVNGAGGWMFFGFMIGHVILFLSAGFLRVVVFLWTLF